jgi:CubicO group peptidase (beta-lactamase class C family)
MKLMSPTILLILVALQAIFIGANNITAQSVQHRINEIIPDLMKEHRVPGMAVAVIDNKRVVLKRGYGYSDVSNEVSTTSETGFNIGSVSKLFTAWGIMTLVESGKLSLDIPVEQYLTRWEIPDSDFDASKVTVGNLLSHTAGFSVHGYPGFPPDTELPSLEASLDGDNGPVRADEPVELIYEPNTDFKYSGGGYTILQLLIEEVSDLSFEEYMEKTVFAPLSMKNTGFAISPDILKSSAKPYDENEKEIYLERFTAKAAAGLHTNVDDLVLFTEALLNKKQVLTDESMSFIMKPTKLSKGQFGSGFRIIKMGGFTVSGHTGSNDGWESALLIHQSSNSALIMLTNSSNGKNLMQTILREWASLIMNREKEQ